MFRGYRNYPKNLGWFSFLKSLHLHEVVVVLLSELFFNKNKFNSMKETIYKISIHLIISSFLTNLEHLIIQIGGQAFPLDRL